MLNRRWWDIAVGGGCAAIAITALVEGGPDALASKTFLLATLGVFVVGYALLGRPAIGEPWSWRSASFIGLMIVVLGVGVSVEPYLALLQTVAFPLVWVISPTRRSAIIGSVLIAISVFLGFAIGGMFSGPALITGLTTAGFSLAFTLALGLWITSIAEYGDERARLLAELTEAQAEVEALSRERGASHERERLARDIHDTLAQTLAGLVLLSERAGRQWREGRTDAAGESIGTVERLAREALAEARAIVARSAAVPADAAFEEAVGRLVERFQSEAGLPIDLTLELGDAPLRRDAQVVVLRCLQEALANVRKHSGAGHVRVRVFVDGGGEVELVVTDDGRGFDALAPRTGFGLDGMSERVALAGGELEIDSAAPGGTTLRVRLPGADVAAGGQP